MIDLFKLPAQDWGFWKKEQYTGWEFVDAFLKNDFDSVAKLLFLILALFYVLGARNVGKYIYWVLILFFLKSVLT